MPSPPPSAPSTLEKPISADSRLRLNAEAAVEADGDQTLHELRVHQLELEMQNEELRRAQVELDLARARYFDLYDLAPVGYCTLSPQGLIVQANLTAVSLLGATRSSVLGRALARFVHREDQGALHALLQHALAEGERHSAELRVVREDHSLFWAHLVVTAGHSEAGAPERRLVLSDVTARREAEEARRAGEARFKDLFSRASDGIVEFDPAGQVLEANAAFASMHGLSVPDVVRLNLRSLDTAAEALTPARLGGMALGEVLTFEVEHRHHAGHAFPLEVSLSQVSVKGAPRLLGFYRDITERRRLHAGLAQSDRLASMGMLAAGVAHEINNPLSYVLANVESLADELPGVLTQPGLLDELIERARGALEGTLRIKAISRSLGSFSRVERLGLESIDLNLALERAAAMAHNEIKYRARLSSELGRLPPVRASEGRLTQVFLNLLINAAHAIDEGHVEENRITLRSWAEDGQVYAAISDTGSGIASENLQRIFEPFFTTRVAGAGSGLGLSICKSLMAELGGDLRVESQPGQGSRFVVRLPASGVAPGTERPAAAPGPLAARGRILVIDDEPAIRTVMDRLLRRAHDVTCVASGLEAKVILETDTGFDVILCDLMMPLMTGMELHAWLVGRAPALAKRLVFVSGGAFTPKAAAYLESVGNLELEKPFDPTELRDLVARLMAGPSDG